MVSDPGKGSVFEVIIPLVTNPDDLARPNEALHAMGAVRSHARYGGDGGSG